MSFVAWGLDWESLPHVKNEKGYIEVEVPNHPNNVGGFVLAHRLVMEAHLGRYLTSEEVVHHINEVKDDNRLENLYLCSQPEHAEIHNRGSKRSLQRRSNIRKGVLEQRRRKNQKSERGRG